MTPWLTLYVGCMCLIMSFCVGLKQILLGPAAVNYPSARPATRFAMFLLSGFMLLRGTDLVLSYFAGIPQPLSPVAVLPSTGLALYFSVQLSDVLHQRLPASFWARVERAVDVATCVTWYQKAWAWFTGNETFEQARRRAARGRPVMPAKQAAHVMGEAALEGVEFAAPREKPRRARNALH